MDIGIDVFFADLNWKNLLREIQNNKVLFYDIPKFPEVKRDLALLVDKNITFAQIAQIAKDTEKKILKNVYLFDVYEGKNLPEGQKVICCQFHIAR